MPTDRPHDRGRKAARSRIKHDRIAGASDHTRLDERSAGFVAVGMWGSYPQDIWVSEHPEGTLVIDLVDARTQKLVWRAYLTAEGAGMSDPAFIQSAVNKAFERYPPPLG